MKVLIATDKPFAEIAVDGIRKKIENAGLELVLLEKYTEKKQLLDAVSDIDGIIIRSDIVDAEVIGAAKKLKIAVRAGAGYDNIDLEAATKAGICVMNTPGQNSNAVAELVFGLLIYAVRNFYNGTSGTELKGKKIGIHAFGNVGRNVARIARGFDMEVYAFDPYIDCSAFESEGVHAVKTVEELYKISNFVSINTPATNETKKSINFELLNNLPKGAVVVNTARKEVIDDTGMIQFLETRTDSKYLTDILPDNHAELESKFPNRYFSTPKKMGAQTAEANINAGIAAAKQIVDFFKNGNEQFRVNKK